MSTVENTTESFDRINLDTSPHQAWLSGHHQRTSSRNLHIMPSDDDDDDDDVDDDDDDDDDEGMNSSGDGDEGKSKKVIRTRPKSIIPLPSDEEDNTDEDDQDELLPIHQAMKRQSQGVLPYRINRSAPTLPQQFEQHPSQQHSSTNSGSAVINTNHRSVSNDDLATFIQDGQNDDDDDDDKVIGQNLRHLSTTNLDVPPTLHPVHQYQQYQQQQQLAQFQYIQQQYAMQPRNQKQPQSQQQQRMATMSGMELLIQREQEKAEAKRQKPKMNPGKVKIEGLLGNLPESGTHNINFQHIQQQQQQQQQQQRQQQQQHMHHPTTHTKKHTHTNTQGPYGYIPSMYDYSNNGRSSVPPMYSAQPSSFYQLPNYTGSGNLYMAQPPPQQNRPASAILSPPSNIPPGINRSRGKQKVIS